MPKVWTGSAWLLKPAKVWTGTAWAQKPVKRWSGSAWVLESAPMALTVSPSSVYGSGTGTTVYTAPATASVTGGSGSFTYAWSKLGGDSMSATNPSSATTQFLATGMLPDQSRGATFQCAVTDTVTGQVLVGQVIAEVDRIGNN